jgi:serine phosphatase RsbU (regulator of sigma subunit)/TPR repeat protein
MFIILFLISFHGMAQESASKPDGFADKEFYLVDDLILKEIEENDRLLVDSCLQVFHKAKDDTSKIQAIEYIIEMCWDDNVWPKYNLWVYSFVVEKLKTQHSIIITKLFKKSLASTLNNIGYNFTNQGNIPKALEYYHKSLKIQKEIGDKEGVASSLNNIGHIYGNQGDISKSLEFFNKSLKIQEKIGEKRGIALSLNNIGYLYNKKGDLPKALEYYHKSLIIQEEIDDKNGIATSLNNIGYIYKNQEDIPKTLEYFNKSLKLREEIGDKEGVSTCLNNIGDIMLAKGNVQEALIYSHRSLLIAQEIGYPEKIKQAATLLYEVYIKQGRGMMALEMYKLSITMRDSINNEATQKATIRQQTKYEFEKVQAVKDKEHEKQLEVEKEAKAKQKVITYATAGGLGLVGIFLFFVMNRLKVTRKQKTVIEQQKEVVEEAHQEIKDSITYAKRIQSAILPPAKLVKEYLKESFILYKPKDVVAGDFYWMETINWGESRMVSNEKQNPLLNTPFSQLVLFAAADCTGHGVPGAMVSVVCNNALNRSVREHGLTKPGEILTKTREIVIQEFEKSEEEVKDGMDIALCSLEGNKLQYAGANNPLWIIRPLRHSGSDPESGEKEEKIVGQASNDGFEIIETRANKQPIGQFDNPEPYTTHSFDLEKGDSIYIFSDGYVDQFGGEKGKKFKAKAFRELLLSIQNKEMEGQRKIIDNAFEEWRGSLEQIDDVCVIGVRV